VKYRRSDYCGGTSGAERSMIPSVTVFTAIIQVGAILAVIIYFRSDIGRLASAWLRGLVKGKTREAPDYRFAWCVILGLIPIGIVRLSSPRPDLGASAQLVGRGGGSARGLERGDVDHRAGRQAGSPGVLAQPEGRSDHRFGAVRCPDSRRVSFPGQPSARACLRDLDRVAATRLAFFLAIPALVASGAYEAIKEASVISTGVGCLPTVLATEVSFVVGYASIAWLLRFVAKHSITVFIRYRVAGGGHRGAARHRDAEPDVDTIEHSANARPCRLSAAEADGES
jgi:undecaprenyl-diphosphatase